MSDYCAVTNCHKPAENFVVGDRLRGSFCEDHQDISKSIDGNPHEGASHETLRHGDALSNEGTRPVGEER